MTSQRLYGILKFVDSLDKKLGLQTKLEAVREALSNLVNQPANPTYQSNLATALAAFTTAAGTMAQSIAPSQHVAISEMGGDEFFDPAIIEKVNNAVQTNAMTPSVARDLVQDLATRRAAFLETVRTGREALEKLRISDSDIKPGGADVAFLIPREIFDNKLVSFAKELTFLSRLVQDFTEAQTGSAEPVTLEQLSSSIPTVTIMANLAALGMLATVIKKFLKTWQMIEEIREMRARLATMGLKGTALQELTEQISTTVTEVVEESTELVIANYKGNRKNELANAVRMDTRRLFGQIERGLTVEFRAKPQPNAEGEDQKNLEEIANVAKELKFPVAAKEPLLLTAEEILGDPSEADGVRVITQTKKTTTQKTTVSRKEPVKEGKDGKE